MTTTLTQTVPPSPSPSPAPTIPDAAKQPTPAGAQEFVRYFFAVYNHAFWSTNPLELQAISDSKCVFCNNTIQRIYNVKSGGHHVIGGNITVTTAVAAPGDPTVGLLVNLVLDQTAGKTVASDGRIMGTTPEVSHSRMDVATRWETDHWVFLDAHTFAKGES